MQSALKDIEAHFGGLEEMESTIGSLEDRLKSAQMREKKAVRDRDQAQSILTKERVENRQIIDVMEAEMEEKNRIITLLSQELAREREERRKLEEFLMSHIKQMEAKLVRLNK